MPGSDATFADVLAANDAYARSFRSHAGCVCRDPKWPPESETEACEMRVCE
jgi:hypothetical protein